MVGLALVLLVGGTLRVAPPDPTYLVERVVRSGEESRRVSVFRDGTAVLVLREGTDAPAITRWRLTDAVFRSLRQVVEETYPSLEEFPGFAGTPGEAWIELRLAPPARPALIVRLPVTAVPSAAAVRLQRAVDDIDQILAAMIPGREDLSRWRPAVGERLRLDDGSVATVLELLNDGRVIHVRLGDGPAEMFFDLDELRRRGVERLER